MRKAVLTLAILLVAASFGIVSPDLESRLATTQSNQLLTVHIVLKEQFDAKLLNSLVDGMPKPARRMEVARVLQQFSAEKQAGLLGYLASQKGQATDVQSLWILNAVYCKATPAVIRAVAARPEVNYVNYDLAYQPNLLEEDAKPAAPSTDGIAWGVRKINAPAVWALGYTGAGIVCGHIDTGCNYNHPDLADHMWTDPNYPHHGWNFESSTNDPMDASGHGTHTSGTVASDGTDGTQCGVAPDAQIMACRVRTVADSVAESQCWDAMQFVVSPPLSPSNGADLYTMSLGWTIAWAPHQASWRATADNVNAAGVIEVVAAGNERGTAIPNACRCPGNCPPPWWNPQNTGVGTLGGVISIGATDSSDVIASFSSPGPVTWSTVAPYNDYPYPPGLTRPDVSGPGVDITSCNYTGSGYTMMSGTSMATPHTAGVVCLMLSKNPNLSPAVVDSILELTALDLGTTGKDDDYGAGRIDALEAVNYVTGSGGPMIVLRSTLILDPLPNGNNNGRVDPGEDASLQFTLRNSGGADCDNVTGVFRSGNPLLTVTDADGAWGNIPVGGEANNAADLITVHASGTIVPGTAVPCTLVVTGDSSDYTTRINVLLTVGVPPRQPGEIIWGPTTAPGMPVDWGLYGVAYNTTDDRLAAIYYMTNQMYVYSSDSLLTSYGTVTLPEDSCTDLSYCSYDNTFWLLANPSKTVYKMTPTGTILRSFPIAFTDYPVGIQENENTHEIYISDRRSNGVLPLNVYICDTLGALQNTIVHPLSGNYGTRCLSFDAGNLTNPPSLLNMFTWFDATGTVLDSCVMYEMDRSTLSILNSYQFPNPGVWNMRGIEYDPRDGSYWVTIMQGGTTENMIIKVVGFNYGTGVKEGPTSALPRATELAVRAFPNPFSTGTALAVQLAQPAKLNLSVYDNNGRLVRTLAAGQSVVTSASFPWDGRDELGRTVAPGIYFYRAGTATAEAWGKVVLSR